MLPTLPTSGPNPSVGNADRRKKDTRMSKASTSSVPRPLVPPGFQPLLVKALRRVRDLLRRRGRELQPHQAPPAQQQNEYVALANELDLIGAKINTVALELRVLAASNLSEASEPVVAHFQETVTALSQMLDGREQPIPNA